jgi:hypothetical protein
MKAVALSERYGVDDLAAFLSDCDRPTGFMPNLMEQSTPEFHCGLVSRSLSGQGVRQVNPLIVKDAVVVRAKVKEVTRHLSLRVTSPLSGDCHPTQDISGIGDPDDGAAEQSPWSALLEAPSAHTYHLARRHHCLKEAGDRERSPASQEGVTMKKPRETLIILRQAANTLNAKAVPVQAYSFDDFL